MSGPPSVQPSRLGQVLGGRYELLEQLGEGGQSTVYRARDRKEKRDVAVKLLRTDARDPSARERMLREAQAMAALSGGATVRVFDQAATPDGALALVMELLHGRDYEQFLGEFESRGEHVPAATMLRLLRPIADSLERAHANGIIHRDLKPQNVFVVDDAHGGGARLLDFGFAKFLKSRSITAAGMVAGSPSYLAPETWKGTLTIDHRIDVYSFGVILFRSLAGKLPFAAPSLVELMITVTTAPRPSLHALRPDLPQLVDGWVEAALAADPEHRFSSVSAMLRALGRALGVDTTSR